MGCIMWADRITHDPKIMCGRACIRGMRITAGMVVGLVASGHNHERILRAYPELESEDIDAALQYAAWRLQETERPLESIA